MLKFPSNPCTDGWTDGHPPFMTNFLSHEEKHAFQQLYTYEACADNKTMDPLSRFMTSIDFEINLGSSLSKGKFLLSAI